jgi:hypothetical protein
MPVEVFCCYARKDQALLNDLKTHLSPLQRQNLIRIWNDTDITPGSNYETEINKHLNTAQIILLLVSSSFVASEYCYSIEMQRAIERHNRGEARVIPIILYPVHWQYTPIGKLQALPTNGKPISTWQSRDDAFYDVVEGIRKAVEEIVRQQLIIQAHTGPILAVSPSSLGQQHKASRSRKAPLFVLLIMLLLAASTVGIFYLTGNNLLSFLKPTATKTTFPTVTPTHPIPTPPPFLYQADFSHGENGWLSGSHSSQWRYDNVNKVLGCDGTAQNDFYLVAPYQPKTANYAVEAQIQFLRFTAPYTSSNPNDFFGIFVRSSDPGNMGYDSYIINGEVKIRIAQGANPNPLPYGHYSLGMSWHTYRVEVKGNTITFLIDNHKMAQLADNTYTVPGLIGLIDNSTQLNVRSFTVFSL